VPPLRSRAAAVENLRTVTCRQRVRRSVLHPDNASSGSITSHKEHKVHHGKPGFGWNDGAAKKNREENKSSSRVEVRVVAPMKIRGR
jgi:hypothetical protein